jgi:hypothetical protein
MVTKNQKLILGIICAVVSIICAVYVGKAVFQSIIHHEISTAKQEAVQKMKSIDEDKAAESVAKTIHGVHAFKEKVKEKLNKLDSTDKEKGKANGIHDQ